MGRSAAAMLALALLAGATGCCAGPCRFYENAYGWNCPDTEYYRPGPPPPVTTPPGYSTPVDPDKVAEEVGRPSKAVVGAAENPEQEDGLEEVMPPAPKLPESKLPSGASIDSSREHLVPAKILQAGYESSGLPEQTVLAPPAE